MIVINPIVFEQNNKGSGWSRITTPLDIDGKRFDLWIETPEAYGRYLVFERADAFLAGILMFAMMHKHDIICNVPVSSELLFKSEKQLIHTIAKHDKKAYAPKITAETIVEPIKSEGGVATGISLGLDSFTTIAEHYNTKYGNLNLTHLFTFNNGVVGGFYQKNNWDFVASKIFKNEQKVCEELGLPLVQVNTNLHSLYKTRVDFYATYWLSMMVLSMNKLISTYFISSNGEDFSQFKCVDTIAQDCATYDFLIIYAFSTNGLRLLSGGGEKDRMEKMQVVSEFPLGRKYLQSCLTQYYNCMRCQKCKRNLVTMDALGKLEEFSEVYDIAYYRDNLRYYYEWMCEQVAQNNHASDYIRPAYNIIKERNPQLVGEIEDSLSLEKLIGNNTELKRQRNVFRKYVSLLLKVSAVNDFETKLKKFFDGKNIKNIIIYAQNPGTDFLITILPKIGIRVLYVVADSQIGKTYIPPRLPENTVEYPDCDAVVICNVDTPDIIERKLKGFLSVPLITFENLVLMKGN
jgi:hypothetical protein